MTGADKHNMASGSGVLRGHKRLRLVMAGFTLGFGVLIGKAGWLTLVEGANQDKIAHHDVKVRIPRPDISDRYGQTLATDIPVSSLYADPAKMIDVDEAVELLTAALPELKASELRKKLSNRKRRFVWVKREVSPAQRELIHDMGIPGVGFRAETRRIYPMGKLAAHVLGGVDLDSRGIAGLEKFLDDQGALYTASLADPTRAASMPAHTSLDVRVQHAVTDELRKAVEKFRAKAAAGIVLNAKTGEVLALASLPDFSPNTPADALKPENVNRVTAGVFELGSIIKAVTFAMALDAGTATLKSRYDARYPLVIGRARINDFHAQKRILTVPEIFMHSSNIGTGKMALEVGEAGHQAFLKKLGFFDRLQTELPESAKPLLPPRWGKLVTVTASFGHGFAVQPMQGAAVAAALINGGKLIPPTLLQRDAETANALATQVIKPSTSADMRYLFRLNVTEGTAGKAAVPGFRVGGKTGTAEKVVNGRYSKNHRLTSFVGAFPMDDPKYVLLAMLDEPKPLPETYGYATSGWNAVPTAGKIIGRIAPLLGVTPVFDDESSKKLEKYKKQRLKELEKEAQREAALAGGGRQ
jgi:cell division protein FtsI (penicillin-binding protein 3)